MFKNKQTHWKLNEMECVRFDGTTVGVPFPEIDRDNCSLSSLMIFGAWTISWKRIKSNPCETNIIVASHLSTNTYYIFNPSFQKLRAPQQNYSPFKRIKYNIEWKLVHCKYLSKFPPLFGISFFHYWLVFDFV